MIFLSLDDKGECVGTYCNGELHFNSQLPPTFSKTWKYYPFLNNYKIDYANLYVSGRELDEVCPDMYRDDWTTLNNKAKAFIRSFVEAKVSLKENCFYDLIPKQFLIDYSQIKCDIVQYIFNNIKKPENYEFILQLEKLITHIKYKKLNLDKDMLRDDLSDPRTLQFYKKLDSMNTQIEYSQFSSRTGRLTTAENSFPILQLKKDYRKIIKPNGDFFLELDYNAAEVRTFLSLSGKEQPHEDIHEWNKKAFGFASRDEAKKEFIAWLYGARSAHDKYFRKIYDTAAIKNYWDGKYIKNIFGRIIESDDFHTINYVVQSTTADLVLRQALKINDILKSTQSEIAFIIHDSIIIDMKKQDKSKINSIINAYCDTQLGKYRCSAKIGANFGEMKKIL